MRGPVDGAPGDVAGKAQGPFVLPVADERVEGPFFPKRHRLATAGWRASCRLSGAGWTKGTEGDGVNFPAPYVMESPFPQSSRAFFSNSFWNRLGKAYAEEGVGETDSQRSRFLIQQDFKGIKPALQRGFRARFQRFASGGKAILKLGFGVFGVGEARRAGTGALEGSLRLKK